jgi:hypothetical protein
MIKYRNNLDEMQATVQEAMELIQIIRESLEAEIENYYEEDEEHPECEVWKWILAVP